jgi:hypothetical protein
VLTAVADARNRRLFHNLDLFVAGFLDTPFKTRYPGRYWPRENVLQFKRRRLRALGCDELLVRNRSVQAVTYLKVLSHDLTLIMDVPSGDEFSVPVTPHPVGEGRYFDAEGRLADGTTLASRGELFHAAEDREHVRYSLDIVEHRLVLVVSVLSSNQLVAECRQ